MRATRTLAWTLVLAAGCLWTTLVPAAQIVVGQVAPLSGLDSNQARAYAAGMNLTFASVNKSGGVNGHQFTLVTRDDGGRPADTLAAARQLLSEERPLVLAGFFGSRNLADVVNAGILEKEGVPLVGYRTAEIRQETALVYSVRAGLADEISKIMTHLATVGITRIGLLYEEGQGAKVLLQVAETAAKAARVSLIARGSFAGGTAKVNAAVNIFVQAAPQAIIMVCDGVVAAGFIEQYRTAGGTSLLFTHSGADVEQLARLLGEEQMHGVAIAQVTPNPYKIATPISKELNGLFTRTQRLDVPVSYAMMEGFINAKVIVEAVRRMGPRVSREAFVQALDSMAHADLGGYQVGFRPGQRSGSRFVELSIIGGGGRVRQ